MAGRRIEVPGNGFEEVENHPTKPIRRYSREVKTSTGPRTVIILDVHKEIRENTPGLKIMNPEKASR